MEYYGAVKNEWVDESQILMLGKKQVTNGYVTTYVKFKNMKNNVKQINILLWLYRIHT